MKSVLVSALCASLSVLSAPVSAQVQVSGRSVPLAVAVDAAAAALKRCEADGYRVTVSVVDAAGVERVRLRGDHSTIHTSETAFRKAYTVITLGPIFKATTTSALTERIGKTPNLPALSTIDHVIFLAGGVALQAQGEFLGAIGVGGAPGGALDEQCAQAGVQAVQARLDGLGVPSN